MKRVKWSIENERKAKVLYDTCRTLFYKDYPEDELNVVARNIGNSIHDIGPFFSGYISKRALEVKMVYYGKNESKELDKKIVNEHFHGRQNAGQTIVHHFIRHPDTSFDEFKKLLEPYCMVHITTGQENAALSKYQNAGMSWWDSYTSCGIELIDVGTDHMLTKKYLTQFLPPNGKFIHVTPKKISNSSQKKHK